MKKKVFLVLLTIILSFGIFTYVKADSGWDTDYDFGGSSWDYDSGSSSGYHGSFFDDDDDSFFEHTQTPVNPIANLMFLVLIILITILIIYLCIKSSRKNYKNTIKKSVDLITVEQFKKFEPNLTMEEFKKNAYEIYKNIQMAWMNFDYDTLKNLVTDEMYNMYKMQLKTLSLKKQKNIMSEIELLDSQIISINDDKNKEVNLFLTVSMFDYVIKEDTNEVVRGNKKRRLIVEYSITLVKSNNTKLDKCPNCGAELEKDATICSYCRGKINRLSNNYVVSKKECIKQKLV